MSVYTPPALPVYGGFPDAVIPVVGLRCLTMVGENVRSSGFRSSGDVGRAVRRRRTDLAKSVLSAGVLGGTAVLASRGVPNWEANAFDALHHVPRWVDHALWSPMQFGSAWAPPVAAAAGWYTARSWRPVAGSLVAGWGGWWLAKAVKGQIDRGRPAAELGEEAVRSSALTEGLGFVSGHATVAFACAAVLSPYLSARWRIALYVLALTVALSRVVVGAHLPIDAIGGASLGLLLAYLWHFAVGVPATPKA